MKIVTISDTHSRHAEIAVPDGDILVHAGDITKYGKASELADFNDWLGGLPHRHKIVIAGNHDYLFQTNNRLARSILTNATYLEDEAVTVNGFKFYGTPWQPCHHDMAFNLKRGAQMAAVWAKVPDDTDVLITHGPPAGHGDLTKHGDRAGCADLLRRVEELKPILNIFGHIHEGAGITKNPFTTFINASICTLANRPMNMPIVYHLAAISAPALIYLKVARNSLLST